MTNKGIQTTCIVHRIPYSHGNERYFMCLEDQGERSNPVCILLRKIGFNIFQRAEGKLTETDQLKNYPSLHRSNIYITTSLQQLGSSPRRVHDETIYVPPNYVVYDVVPEASWDCESRILLGNIPCSDGIRAMRLGVKGPDGQIKIGLVFGPDGIKSFACDEVTSIPSRLFTRTNRISLMTWRELLNVIPELGYTSNQLDLPNLLSIEIKGFWESTPRASNHNPMTDDWQPMPEPFEYKAYLADGYPQEEQTTAFTPNQHHRGKRKLSENTTGRETVDKDIRSYKVDLADVYSPDGQTSTSILSHQQGAKRKFSENTDPRDTRWMKKDSNPSKTCDGQPSIKHKRRK
ncbi:hypothetical protein NPX13_g5429 [Xylaria arbuscula]|uniref:Uncharacterized protein n=1 Tax=Xylaria arbuscula TaxID=114810 RepID=A0A9W8TN59_9PEZI|nr:hypothetical protein NPX13_g5429 [Xylaria arbuscula]